MGLAETGSLILLLSKFFSNNQTPGRSIIAITAELIRKDSLHPNAMINETSVIGNMASAKGYPSEQYLALFLLPDRKIGPWRSSMYAKATLDQKIVT
jgi:hypothetical protein